MEIKLIPLKGERQIDVVEVREFEVGPGGGRRRRGGTARPEGFLPSALAGSRGEAHGFFCGFVLAY